MNDSEKSYQLIVRRLVRLSRSQARLRALGGLLLALAVFVYLFLLGMIWDQAFVLGELARTTLLVLYIVSCAAVLWFYGIRRLIRKPDVLAAAERVESRFPGFKASLIAAVELWDKRDGSKERYSPKLIEATANEAAQVLSRLDLNRSLTRRFLVGSYRALALALLLVLVYSLIFPASFYHSQLRLMHPGCPFGSYVSLRPGTLRLVRGASLDVDARFWGRVPMRAELEIKGENAPPARATLERVESGHFRGTIPRVDESFEYVLRSKGLRSPEYQVTVLDKPAVVGLKIEYDYPKYTQLPRTVLDEGMGDISGLVGTRVVLKGRANVPLSHAAMVLDDSTVVPGSLVDQDKFEISTEIERDGTYHLVIRDPDGNENTDPINYRISAIDDEYPTVSIVKPARDTNLPKDMTLNLSVSAADDFGLTRFYLVSAKDEKQNRISIASLKGARSEATVSYDWDMSDLNLLPGDIVSYYIEAFDNDTYSGPKRTNSETYRVRFPTLEEIYSEVTEEQDFATEAIETMLPEQKRLRERLDELREELTEQRDLTWEERQSAEEVIERQQKIAEKADEVARALDDLLERMDNSFVVDKEIFTKMQMISQLLSEIQTDELMATMERIRQAMKDATPEELRKAMTELLMNQEELDKRLERTLEILKRLKQEQELERLANKAMEVERQHKALSEETEKGGDQEKLAKEEDELRAEVERIKEEMAKLAEELQESDPTTADALEELSEAMETEDLLGQMSEASQMLSKGMRNSACSRQKKIQEELGSLSSGLRRAHDEMIASRTQEIEEALKEAQNDLLSLSEAQERLNEAISGMESSARADPAELGDAQQALEEGVEKVAEKLYSAAQKSCFIKGVIGRHLGAAIRNMENAVSSLESGRSEAARASGRASQTALNEAVKELMNSMQSLSSCSSPTGISDALESLSSCSSRQMCINQGTMSMLMLNPDAGMLSLEARAEIARLAAEQRMVSEQLSEIAKGMGDTDQLLGDLDALARETDEVARALERTEVSRELVERQERILSRLLDAQRSIRKRDSSPRRKAEVGEDMPWVRGPESLPPDYGEKKKMAQKDLLKALKEAYPKEYEKLIRAYFKSLAK